MASCILYCCCCCSIDWMTILVKKQYIQRLVIILLLTGALYWLFFDRHIMGMESTVHLVLPPNITMIIVQPTIITVDRDLVISSTCMVFFKCYERTLLFSMKQYIAHGGIVIPLTTNVSISGSRAMNPPSIDELLKPFRDPFPCPCPVWNRSFLGTTAPSSSLVIVPWDIVEQEERAIFGKSMRVNLFFVIFVGGCIILVITVSYHMCCKGKNVQPPMRRILP